LGKVKQEKLPMKNENSYKEISTKFKLTWEQLTSIIAIILSIVSLSITYFSENAKATGNIQIIESDGFRDYDNTQIPGILKIYGGIKLKNIGNAPIQVVDVKWESTISSVKSKEINGWLAISDFLDPEEPREYEYFKENRETPISAIHNSQIDRGKVLELKYSNYQYLPDDFNVQDPSLRIIFTFSNGQQITVLPDIRGPESGSGISEVVNANGEPFTPEPDIQRENLSVVKENDVDSRLIPTPTFVNTLSPNCYSSYSKKPLSSEVRKPNNFPRYTIPSYSLETYLYQMSINDICIPYELGYPYINVDWNELVHTSEKGRLISIGFDNLYNDNSWSKIFLLYSTYDFVGGLDYDPIMTEVDWEKYRKNNLENTEELQNGKGFVLYKQGFGSENYPIYKADVYPLEDGYISLVINLGIFSGKFSDELEKIQKWELPDDDYKWLPVFERMVGSLKISKKL